MKIILNFLPLKSGGGVQVGIDFIQNALADENGHDWYLVSTEGTAFDQLGETPKFKHAATVGRGRAARFMWELFGCKKLLRSVNPDVIYTQFGPQWLGAGDYPNVVGCAYSNLFYPEIAFWKQLPKAKRFGKWWIDQYRLARLQAADAVIFETKDLANRAVAQQRLKAENVHTVLPAASTLVRPGRRHEETQKKCKSIPPGFRVLLLANYYANKNIEILPRVASHLRKALAVQDVVFVITLAPERKETQKIQALAEDLGVGEMIFNLGTVPSEGCAEVYSAADAVILPSQLESFSNTIAESWVMEKPLLISDATWSRDLCRDGAIYINQNDASDIARKIARMRESPSAVHELVQIGKQRLLAYPDSRQRFSEYLGIIESVAKRASGLESATAR